MILTTHVLKRGKRVSIDALPPKTQFKVWVQCPQCQETRYVMLVSVRNAGHCICQKCAVKSTSCKPIEEHEKHNMLAFVQKLDNGKAKFLCDCGSETIADLSAVRTGRTRSCGCLRKNNRFPATTGETHPNWKGGVTAERERFMQTVEYKAWRNAVFKRDGYTCRACGQVGYGLEAHHIEPYNLAQDKRTLVENGATLCESCHRDFHAKYGRKSAGRREFDEFTTKEAV